MAAQSSGGLALPLCAARRRRSGQPPVTAAAPQPAAQRTLKRGVLPERMVARGWLSVAPQPFGQGLAQDLAGREAERLRSRLQGTVQFLRDLEIQGEGWLLSRASAGKPSPRNNLPTAGFMSFSVHAESRSK
ncbi:hypothetical protein AHiyo8_43240 [Arthrobacter sp. Hiyo8]|nr:hypothetical protein AHiyo8_43240 [Arthrobacter sp. Hiyo8]